jgi:hypothetical protein
MPRHRELPRALAELSRAARPLDPDPVEHIQRR